MSVKVEYQKIDGKFALLGEYEHEAAALKDCKTRVAYWRVILNDGRVYDERLR